MVTDAQVRRLKTLAAAAAKAGMDEKTARKYRGLGRLPSEVKHVIDWLVRKPGAFEDYRWRDELFPTSRFRVAYDQLKQRRRARGHKDYLQILHLAAHESETAVDEALRHLIDQGQSITVDAVQKIVRSGQQLPPPTDVTITPTDLAEYDTLLDGGEVA